MLTQLTRNWQAIMLRGGLAILFGAIALVWPKATIGTLILFFGGYMFVDGVFTILAAVTNRNGQESWWVFLLEGLAGIAVGIITFLRPGLTAFALLYIIAYWAMLTGVLEVFAAIRLRKEIQGEWMLALSGGISFILGILLLLFPAAGVLTIVWMIGWYAILFGAMLLGLSWRLHQLGTFKKVTPAAI